MRVNADEFQLVGPCEDVLEHGQCRPIRHGFHRGGERLVLFGDLLVAQVVRVLHVVVQFALGLRVPVTGITIAFGDVRVRNSRRHACWISREFVQYAECRGIGAGRQQRHAELLILMRGGDVFVATGVNAGGHAQHHAGTLAESSRDGGDAGRLIRLVHDDFRKALLDGEFDFRVGLVVTVQHQTTAGDACGERDAHLPHRACVDEHACIGHQPHDFFGEERLTGETHVRGGVGEGVGRRAHEISGAGGDFVSVDQIQRGSELVKQRLGGALVERQGAFGIHCRRHRPDGGDTLRSVHTHSRSSHCSSFAQGLPLFLLLCHCARTGTVIPLPDHKAEARSEST